MVRHIIEQSRRAGGWVKQPYFAVTVPDHYGLRPVPLARGAGLPGEPGHAAGRDRRAGDRAQPVPPVPLRRAVQPRRLVGPHGLQGRERLDAHAQLRVGAPAARLPLPRSAASCDRAIAGDGAGAAHVPGLRRRADPAGRLLHGEGRHGAGRSTLFRALVQRQPDDPEVRYYYGVTLAFQRDAGGGAARVRRGDPAGPDLRPALLRAPTTRWARRGRSSGRWATCSGWWR